MSTQARPRWRRYPATMPAADRILARVDRVEGGCWNWLGTTSPKGGYGRMWNDGRHRMAHRVSYETFIGPIPEGLTVDHLCFNGSCVNPDHLRLLSHEENSRIQRKGIATHCQRGHEFTPENTWTASGSRRTCKTCARMRYARAATRKRAS